MTAPATTSAWWARRWQTFLKQLGLAPSPENGALRGCRVKRLEVLPGMVQAQVQDRELGASAVEISIPVLDDKQWKFITDALGGQAIFAAQLLAGNMPPEIEDVFAQAGATLLPSNPGELTHTCSACPSGATPCRPVSAVYYQLGEMVAEDPWLLLRLRGRDRQQLLAAVHEQRNAQASSEGPTRPQRTVPAETRVDTFYQPHATVDAANDTDPSLELQIEDFWGRRKVLEQVHHHLTRPAVELALLRRLGPPTPSPDGVEAFAQLQQIYRRVTDRVWALAFAPEEELESGGEEGGLML